MAIKVEIKMPPLTVPRQSVHRHSSRHFFVKLTLNRTVTTKAKALPQVAFFLTYTVEIIFADSRQGTLKGRGRLSTVALFVITSLDQLLVILKTLFTFFPKQATLMRRSTVQSLPLQLGFPAFCLVSPY